MRYEGGFLYLPERLFSAIVRILGAKWALFKAQQTFQQIGLRSYIAGTAHFRQPSIVSIGNDCKIYERVRVVADYPGGRLDLKNNVQINADVHLDTTGGLTIGDNTLISEQAQIYTHDHRKDPRSTPILIPKKIGENVWIGMRAIILPGCETIGDGVVIGAGAVVTKSIPEHVIIAGNPGRVVGSTMTKI